MTCTQMSWATGREECRVSRAWEKRHFPELASHYAIRSALSGVWQLLTLSVSYTPMRLPNRSSVLPVDYIIRK